MPGTAITGAGLGRGIFRSSQGGAYSAAAAADLADCDAFQTQIVQLSGTADVINPYAGNENFVVVTGSADAITIPAPVAGADDNLTVAIYSNTAFAHSVTAPVAGQIQNGATGAFHIITFPAFAGAGVLLRAFQGKWNVVGSTGALAFS